MTMKSPSRMTILSSRTGIVCYNVEITQQGAYWFRQVEKFPIRNDSLIGIDSGPFCDTQTVLYEHFPSRTADLSTYININWFQLFTLIEERNV